VNLLQKSPREVEESPRTGEKIGIQRVARSGQREGQGRGERKGEGMIFILKSSSEGSSKQTMVGRDRHQRQKGVVEGLISTKRKKGIKKRRVKKKGEGNHSVIL